MNALITKIFLFPIETFYFNNISQTKRFCFILQKDCSKGKLDKKKFIEVYKQFYPTGKADKFCSHVFKTFDTDNSGEIGKIHLIIFE